MNNARVTWNASVSDTCNMTVHMAAIDKVRILVVGDSGVGKSSLVHLICHSEPITNASWTVGCSVDVKPHEYKEGTPMQKTYFIELWDIGGSTSHSNTRSVFFNPAHGIILVHDLTNRKTQQNLHRWLAEILNKETNSKGKQSSYEDFDPEQFAGSTQVPTMVIGTKLDLVEEIQRQQSKRTSSVAEECGADEVSLDCHQQRSLAPGSSSAVKLSRFFDKVIERHYYSRDKNSPYLEKRRTTFLQSQKLYHNN